MIARGDGAPLDIFRLGDSGLVPGNTSLLRVRTNLHPNPRWIGEDGKAGGGSASWAQEDVTTGGPDGGGWTRITADATQTGDVDVGNDVGARVAVTPGQSYAALVHMMAEVNVPGFSCYIQWQTSGGAALSNLGGATALSPALGAWVDLPVTGVAPANAAYAQIRARLLHNAENPLIATESFGVAMRAVKQGSGLLASADYHDGDSPNTETTTNAWTGTPHASTSVQKTVAVTPASLARLAHWSFNEGAGTTATDSVGGRVLTVDSWAPGKYGTALGLGGAVQIPDPVGLQTPRRTLMFWLRITEAGSGGALIRFYDSISVPHWGVQTNPDGTLSYQNRGRGSFYSPVVSIGEWHHVAMTHDGTTLRGYYDGALVGSTDVAPGDIGASATIFRPRYEYDDLRFYSEALPESAIRAMAGLT